MNAIIVFLDDVPVANAATSTAERDTTVFIDMIDTEIQER